MREELIEPLQALLASLPNLRSLYLFGCNFSEKQERKIRAAIINPNCWVHFGYGDMIFFNIFIILCYYRIVCGIEMLTD